MKIADTIKHQIEDKLCPVHDMHPVVDATGEEISVACCCNYFQKYCIIEVEYLKSHINSLTKHVDGLRILNSLHKL
ncbi:MAG: hypothetical protein ACXVJB_14045 [Mucilaginibacter sp.]